MSRLCVALLLTALLPAYAVAGWKIVQRTETSFVKAPRPLHRATITTLAEPGKYRQEMVAADGLKEIVLFSGGKFAYLCLEKSKQCHKGQLNFLLGYGADAVHPSGSQSQFTLLKTSSLHHKGVAAGRKCDVYRVETQVQTLAPGSETTTNRTSQFCFDPQLPLPKALFSSSGDLYAKAYVATSAQADFKKYRELGFPLLGDEQVETITAGKREELKRTVSTDSVTAVPLGPETWKIPKGFSVVELPYRGRAVTATKAPPPKPKAK